MYKIYKIFVAKLQKIINDYIRNKGL